MTKNKLNKIIKKMNDMGLPQNEIAKFVNLKSYQHSDELLVVGQPF